MQPDLYEIKRILFGTSRLPKRGRLEDYTVVENYQEWYPSRVEALVACIASNIMIKYYAEIMVEQSSQAGSAWVVTRGGNFWSGDGEYNFSDLCKPFDLAFRVYSLLKQDYDLEESDAINLSAQYFDSKQKRSERARNG